jgi:chorismate synthase
MAGDSFGKLFRVTTFGESHGAAIGVVVEGVPPNIELCEADIQKELDRRRPGQSKVSTPRAESDTVEILSGVFQGRTMGPPVSMLIRNRNQDPGAYREIREKYRPGHADYGFLAKYGVRDWRGSGRASGRETACRVAAGAVARKILAGKGISVVAFARQIADVKAETIDLSQIEQNIVRTADANAAEAMISRIEAAKEKGNSVGGVIELRIQGCPAGLGEPVFDKIEAQLAHAIMSVGAVKGVEVGAGFGCASMTGLEFNDEFADTQGQVMTVTNNCGGVLGGITTGGEIVLRAAIRPPASIAAEQKTVTVAGEPTTIQTHGRHDPCIVPRAVPVLEAMAAIVIADALLCQAAYDQYRCGPQEAAEFMSRDV